MKSHAFHPEARAEFKAEIRYYEMARPGWGRRFRDEIMAAIRRARAFPTGAPVVPSGVRKLVVEKFPFVIYDEIIRDTVVIWAVMHGARRPDYWLHRRQTPPI